jgi:HPr kinase/phosphorylase
MSNFTVLDLLDLDLKEHDDLELHCIGGRAGLVRELTVPDLNRPGLALSGFFENFAVHRIQLFGQGENAYLRKMEKEGRTDTVAQIFKYPIPCCVFSHGLEPTDTLRETAEQAECPILQTTLSSADFSIRVIRILSNVFAPHKMVHGVLVEVFGIGVLIMGDSGVGKSETALELIERNHRLIADDSVELRCVNGNMLIGQGANRALGHHMEIRGLGIINVSHLFGVGAIRDTKQVQLVVQLEEWDSDKVYDRIGSGESYYDILDVKIPLIHIPVKPGRNVPILIETAAMNERLKKMGYFSAREFNENVLRWLESENARNLYFQNKDTF